MSRIATVLVIVVTVLASVTSSLGDPPVRDAILAQWKSRAEAVQSASFEWSHIDGGAVRDIDRRQPVRFSFDGPKFSYRYNAISETGGDIRAHYRFDGETMSHIFSGAGLPHGQAAIHSEKHFFEVANPKVQQQYYAKVRPEDFRKAAFEDAVTQPVTQHVSGPSRTHSQQLPRITKNRESERVSLGRCGKVRVEAMFPG